MFRTLSMRQGCIQTEAAARESIRLLPLRIASRRSVPTTGHFAIKTADSVSQSVAFIEIWPILVTEVQTCRVRVALEIEASGLSLSVVLGRDDFVLGDVESGVGA